MKTLFLLLMALMVSLTGLAQTIEYKTFIYTDEDLSEEIQLLQATQDSTRRFGSDLLNATLNAAKGIGSGYVTSFIDMGVNAIASLITRNARLRQEWEETVAAENTWTYPISSVQEMRDFYKEPSRSGALDPLGMCFDGIGCLRMEGQDTVFFLSCHIDRSKLHRIVNHSKFELVLDTLIVSPLHSNLPNTYLPLTYSFEERQNFTLSMNIKLYSSWFTDAIELYTDARLGEFNVTIPVDPDQLDEKGFLRYVRPQGEPSRYPIIGESFIIPRSYMGYRDETGMFRNVWGTGQYKLDIELKETCDVTNTYRENWKQDRKRRKKLEPEEGLFPRMWETVSSQQWDEITQSWVITTLSAPAGLLSNKLIEELKLTPSE